MAKTQQEIADQLREYLLTKERTQRDLADKIGISTTHLSNYLRGAERISRKVAERIVELWPEIRLAFLLSGDGSLTEAPRVVSSGPSLADEVTSLREQLERKSRALTAEQLRAFFALEPATERAREALDLFKLSFYLRGMNGVDISKAGPGDIFNGRLLYERTKTGRPYSVKIEPETEAIIARRGNSLHLFAPMANFASYARYIQDVDANLKTLAKAADLPPVTMYWARHTFASLVIETGGTMEILAGALGHAYGPRITAGYVTLQQRQVDEAVRRVFDYIKK